jgi:hypothetical protein
MKVDGFEPQTYLEKLLGMHGMIASSYNNKELIDPDGVKYKR